MGGLKLISIGVMNYLANNANENSSPPINNKICEIFIIFEKLILQEKFPQIYK